MADDLNIIDLDAAAQSIAQEIGSIDANEDKHFEMYISCLNGVPTSELASIERLDGSIAEDTKLLLAKSNGDQTYSDAALLYKTLSSQLNDDMPRTEMMREDEHSFAIASHVHPEYSWLKVWPDFGKNGKHRDAEVSAVLATVHFKSNGVQNDIDICLPKIKFDLDSPRPKHFIGELMFVAADSFEGLKSQVGNIDNVDADDFTGWIYPAGQTILTKRFEYMEAKTAFGAASTATSFTVPKLDGFFCPTTESDEAMQKTPGENAVPMHSHAGAAAVDATSSIKQTASVTEYIKNGRSQFCQPLSPESAESGNYGVICAWSDEVLKLPNYQCPAAVPAGYRELTDSEKDQMFNVKYNDASFDTQSGKVSFKVKSILVEKSGTQYDKSDEEGTMSWPETTFIPVLLYIGFPDNSIHKYWS